MADKKTNKSAESPELTKYKGIIKNQIIEIQELQQKLLLSANKKNKDQQASATSPSQKALEEQKKKLLENLNTKDKIIAALKKDLKSNQREIEGHLKRHNDELIKVHNRHNEQLDELNSSIMNERFSRDYLVNNLTQELILALKSGTALTKPKSSGTKENAVSKRIKVNPKIETIHLPDYETKTSKDKLDILFLAPSIPNFDESSGGKRAYHLLKLLAEQHNIICYSRKLDKQNHKDILESHGIKVITELEQSHIIEKIPNVDVIIVAWYFSYFDFSMVINHFPKAKLIVDSVDIHWVREERSIGTWEGITMEKQQENKQNEINVYEKADIIWVVSEEDKKAVLEEIPVADVRIVSNVHIMKEDTFIKDKPNKILFFGGYNHYPNINAVKILGQEIFPKIKNIVPDAELIIAGSNAPNDIIELGELPGVDYRGFINFADIRKLYAESKLTIVPLTEGAGIKGKICESIEYRTPVITNDIGNEGINIENGVDGFLTNDYDEMVKYAIDILQDKIDLEPLTAKAQEKVKLLLGTEANLKVMNESFIPTVDICIVTYNRKDLLKDCIDSIFKNTRYKNYNIIVYSNGCEDSTVDYLKALTKKHDHVDCILSDTNDVFVKPNNSMMRLNPSHDVVLINNDVQVTEGWLQALVDEAYKSKTIGIVGSKIIYPNNELQEFGSELYSSGSGMNIGKHDDPNDLKYMRPKKASYVSGCSMYIKRKTILEIGVFDELFHPCYAEDSDYCYTAWEKGIEVNVTPKSIVYHLEGASSGTDTSSGFKRFQNINIQKFLSKHGSTVEKINKKVHNFNSEYPFLK